MGQVLQGLPGASWSSACDCQREAADRTQVKSSVTWTYAFGLVEPELLHRVSWS
jgi:hypothetical protein